MAVSLLVSLLAVPVGAASVTKFSDVNDSYTATAIETLRLMGVLDGYGDGTFRPDTVLNRAQFCKMAVYAMDGSGELGFHRDYLPGCEALPLGVRLYQHGLPKGNHLRLCRW